MTCSTRTIPLPKNHLLPFVFSSEPLQNQSTLFDVEKNHLHIIPLDETPASSILKFGAGYNAKSGNGGRFAIAPPPIQALAGHSGHVVSIYAASIHAASIMTTAKRPGRSSLEFLTIGHSNLALETLIGLLQQHQVEVLVDIRRFPGSRTFPQFNQVTFSAALQAAGIAYCWIEQLGGRRPLQHLKNPSLNLGLRNASFRNYGDYMQTPAFREGFAELMEIVRAHRAVIMCSESVYWRCHRRLVSDYAIAAGLTVQHIFSNGTLRPHQLTAGALIKRKRVTYPGLPME